MGYRAAGSLPIGLHYGGPRAAAFNLLVVLDGSGNTAYSNDGGENWSVGGNAGVNNWTRSMPFAPSLGAAGRLLVLESSATGAVRYTDDGGLTWQNGAAPLRQWQAVDWSEPLGFFAGVGSSGLANQRACLSADGGVSFATAPSVAALAWDQCLWVRPYGLFIASTVGGGSRIMTAVDGFSWIDRGNVGSNPSGPTFLGYLPSTGRAFVVSAENSTPATTVNGTAWANSPTPILIDTGAGGGLAVGPDVATLYCRQSTVSYFTVDGVSWTAFPTPIRPFGNGDLLSAYVGNGRMVLIRTTAPFTVIASEDGVAWAPIGEVPNQGNNPRSLGVAALSLAA